MEVYTALCQTPVDAFAELSRLPCAESIEKLTVSLHQVFGVRVPAIYAQFPPIKFTE